MTIRHYARVYLTPGEIRAVRAAARRADESVSDYVRRAIDLPSHSSRRATSGDVTGSAHHERHRCIKVRLVDDDEAAHLTAAAIAVDATDNDYVRMRLGLERMRPTRVRYGAPIGNRNRAGR